MLNSIFASLEECLPRMHHLVKSVRRRKMVAKIFKGAVPFEGAVPNRSPLQPWAPSGFLGLKIGHQGPHGLPNHVDS